VSRRSDDSRRLARLGVKVVVMFTCLPYHLKNTDPPQIAWDSKAAVGVFWE
jgi:predicted aconitase